MLRIRLALLENILIGQTLEVPKELINLKMPKDKAIWECHIGDVFDDEGIIILKIFYIDSKDTPSNLMFDKGSKLYVSTSVENNPNQYFCHQFQDNCIANKYASAIEKGVKDINKRLECYTQCDIREDKLTFKLIE